jgi:hypothetical protein
VIVSTASASTSPNAALIDAAIGASSRPDTNPSADGFGAALWSTDSSGISGCGGKALPTLSTGASATGVTSTLNVAVEVAVTELSRRQRPGTIGVMNARRERDARRHSGDGEVAERGAGIGDAQRIGDAERDRLVFAAGSVMNAERRALHQQTGQWRIVGIGRAVPIWSFGAQQRQRRLTVGDLIDGDGFEIRARRRRAAVAGRRQDRLIGRDRKQAREFGARHGAIGIEFDRDVGERQPLGIVERLNGQRRMVVEQDDQTVASMDEGDVLVADRREIELRCPVEMDNDRLIGLRLGEFDDLWRFGIGQGTGDLRNRNASVHNVGLSVQLKKDGFFNFES